MTVSVVISTYGDNEWKVMAAERAEPSAWREHPDEVIIYHGGNTIAESRNNAVAHASGEWLLMLDADDELAPGYLGAMRRAVEHLSDGDKLLTPAVQQIRKGRPGAPFFFPECSLETGNWLIIGTLIRRDLFNKIGGFREHPHGLEDWNLWARAVRAGARILKVPDAVYVAHMNPKSKHHVLSRNRPEYMAAYERARVDAWG